MESQDQITALDTTVSEQTGVEEETIASSDNLPVKEDKSNIVTEGKGEIESASTYVSCVSVNKEESEAASTDVSFDKKLHASSGEFSNIAIDKEKKAPAAAESSNVSVDKKEFETAEFESSDISCRKKTFTLSPKEVLPEVGEMAASSDSLTASSFTDADKFAGDKKGNQMLYFAGSVPSAGQVESKKYDHKAIESDSPPGAVFYKSTVGTAEKSGGAYASSTSTLQTQFFVPNVSTSKNTMWTRGRDLSVDTLRTLASRKISFPEDSSKPGTDTTEGIDASNKYENLFPRSDTLQHSTNDPAAPNSPDDNEDSQTEAVNNTAPTETEPEPGEMDEDNERKAFFYISSSSIPGMDKDWDWPSVSSEYYYQRPTRRPQRRITHQYTPEPRRCLGTQRCHYVILAIAILGAISGCVTYHLQDYGIGPKVLRPIGASTAFLSFVVCAVSSIYLTYLCYYPHGRTANDYQVIGASDSDVAMQRNTQPEGYYDERGNYVSTSRSGNSEQCYRETQSADVLDRSGYDCQQTEVERTFDQPSTSGYNPNSQRIKMNTTTSTGEVYELKNMSKERSASQASDTSVYDLAEQPPGSSRSGGSENAENIPLLPKK